jgi:hypothetical protein
MPFRVPHRPVPFAFCRRPVHEGTAHTDRGDHCGTNGERDASSGDPRSRSLSQRRCYAVGGFVSFERRGRPQGPASSLFSSVVKGRVASRAAFIPRCP